MKLGRMGASYGRGEVTIEDDIIDAGAVAEALGHVFASPSYRPPTLPRVALEVMELARSPDVDFARVASVVEQDGLVAAQVMRVASSAAYGGGAAVPSIAHAIARLGLRTMRDLVFEIALQAKVFRVPAYQPAMDALARHSIAVAHVARVVARFTALEAEYAFLCGLLHDIGVAGVLIALAERGPAPPVDEVWSAVHAFHAEAGERMVKLWGLPVDLSFAVLAHHRVLVDGHVHPMAATVRLADVIAKDLGFATRIPTVTPVAAVDERPLGDVVHALGLSGAQLEALKKDAQQALLATFAA